MKQASRFGRVTVVALLKSDMLLPRDPRVSTKIES